MRRRVHVRDEEWLQAAAERFVSEMPKTANASDNAAWAAWGVAVEAFEVANGLDGVYGLRPRLWPYMSEVPFDIATETGPGRSS